MDYKEKLKAIISSTETPFVDIKTFLKYFPELKVSKDEGIRKSMVEFFQNKKKILERSKDLFRPKAFPAEELSLCNNALTYLEKQSKQEEHQVYETEDGEIITYSETDGYKVVEPKFKVGDWLIYENGSIYYVNKVYEHTYELVIDNGNKPRIPHELIDKKARLWTIRDAKDGDMLATLDYILIFKKLLPKDGGVSYCHYDFGAGNPQFVWFEDKNWYFGKEAIIHPATKEQRDLLFKKMKEAGYEWDAEKKELKKIKPKFNVDQTIKKEGFNLGFPIVKIEDGFYYNDMGDHFPITDQDCWELVEQKPTWSEEDERSIRDSIFYLKSAKKYFEKDNDILWDEKWFSLCIKWLESLYKRLQPQSTWKPTDEQVEALETYLYNPQYISNSEDKRLNLVESLYKQLKKLRED